MSNKEIYEKLMLAAKNEHKTCRKMTKVSEMEQECHYYPVLEGIRYAALYLLPTDDYFKWCAEVMNV